MENFGFSNVPPEPNILNGYFNGLFPSISTENSIINYYEEIYLPSEPVLKDTTTHTFYIPRKPTNTWTALSQSTINCGFTFEKKVVKDNEITWEAVRYSDNAVPCSGLTQAFWSDVDIRLNQTRVTNNRHNSQMTSILSKLTTSHYYPITLGRLSGVADDTVDPDKFSNENSGFKLRQSIYCRQDSDVEKSSKMVHLRGPLYSNVSANPWPIPSEIDIFLSMTRNKNEVLITQNDQDPTNPKSDIFRINLEYIEVIIPRLVIDPAIHEKIEKHLEKKSIEMVYNRIDLRSFVIGPGTLNFDSGSLFQGFDIPPVFIVFVQNQKRVAGDFKKSIHHFELPGGLDQDGNLNLKTLTFTIDQEKFARYKSSKQGNVETGSLMKSYHDTLINLTALQSTDLPKFEFEDYSKWSFINAYRTTPIETSLNYIDQQSNIKIPVIRAGNCQLHMSFNNPTAPDNLQSVYVCSIRPTILKIDSDRRVTTSFTQN